MGKDKQTPIMIDDVQYVLEDMKPEQQAMVNHIADLDRKIGSTQFNLEQLQVGKQAFIDMLKKSLTEVVEVVQ
jgi:hypothetical protein